MSNQLTPEQISALAQAAAQAKVHSYSPYSKFKVGASVLTEDGQIYTGTNIENVSYGLTLCAERNAIFKAVCDGHRRLAALAVCTDYVQNAEFGSPCGACRQVMTEFMPQSAPLILVAQPPQGPLKTLIKTLADFMPYPFSDLGN